VAPEPTSAGIGWREVQCKCGKEGPEFVNRECLFCGAQENGVLSKEHMIPKWLLEFLELPDDDRFFQGVAETTSGKLVEKREHSSFSFLEGRVCEECNTG
jgi:hypothetical protein